MDSALTVQRRVIFALMMNEMHTIYGTTTLGYLWALIQAIWGILVFWGMRIAMNFTPPHGTNTMLFLIAGFGVYNTFSSVLNRCLNTPSCRASILTYPQVTPVDLYLARTIIMWATQIVACFLIVLVGSIFGIPCYLGNIGGFFCVLTLTPLMGMGLGIMFGSLSVLWTPLSRIITMLMRILMFASAVFYSAMSIPSAAMKYAWYNPVLQLVEWCRVCLSNGYTTIDYNPFYLLLCTITSLCLGLLFERYVRGKDS